MSGLERSWFPLASASSSSFVPATTAAFASNMNHLQRRRTIFSPVSKSYAAVVDPAFVTQLSLQQSNYGVPGSDSLVPGLMATTESSVSSGSSTSEWTAKSLRQQLNIGPLTGGEASAVSMTRSPYIVGHRGCIYQELENTREGFDRCAELGVQAAELDVFVLKCGTVIVFHGGGTDENPGDLLDYCGVPGNILDMTYEEALQLKFTPEYAEFPCPGFKITMGSIPTLELVLLDAKRSGLHLKIELKGEGVVEPTLDVVERLDMLSQCSFSTFDLDRLALLRKLRPDKTLYKTGALFNDLPGDYLDRARKAGATEIHLRYDTCTKKIVREIHEAGFGSMLWMRGAIGMANDCREKYWDVGNEDETMYLALLQTGVQQFCVNKPDVMVGLRDRLAEESFSDVPEEISSYNSTNTEQIAA